MPTILTRIHEPREYHLLALCLLDTCPLLLSNRLLRSWPFAWRPSVLSFYSVVLAVLLGINLLVLGLPRFHWAPITVLWGVALAALIAGVELAINLGVARRFAPRPRPGALQRGRPLPPLGQAGWERAGQRMWEVPSRFPLLTLLIGGALEEVLFRFYFFNLVLELGGGPVLAVALSALAYGLMHESFGPASVISKTLAGVLLGCAYIGFQNLAVPVVAHVGFNLAAHVSQRLQKVRGRAHA